MTSRIDTLTYSGFGLLGVGTTGELVKEAAKDSLECPPLQQIPVKEISENIMDINLFFGYFPGYELNLTGIIAISGLVMMYLASRRGNKAKKHREEMDRIK